MVYDPDDTIAAIGTASGGALRGMVRISGPRSLECLGRCFLSQQSLSYDQLKSPLVVPGVFQVSSESMDIPCDLFLWPTSRSYTRQPTAEIHTLGSTPLLESVLSEVCRCGARVAEPGEFTLRAFLAGRMDLTQAEAVLGVIDASDQESLNTALTQLAGGLSGPLSELREQLLQILAELEAGLDFVEEDIEFISSEQLSSKLSEAGTVVNATIRQMASRSESEDLPRIALIGLPNAGKSSLFNTILAHCEQTNCEQTTRAIVSSQSGTTRDYVTAKITIEGIACELVDTAGQELIGDTVTIEQAAQEMTDRQFQQAHLRLICVDGAAGSDVQEQNLPANSNNSLIVQTKSDLRSADCLGQETIRCSSLTGEGIDTLLDALHRRLQSTQQNEATAVASTAARCLESLQLADESLVRSIDLVQQAGGEELVAAEVRDALLHLGRVVGTVYTDDVLDRIFSQFCIGK